MARVPAKQARRIHDDEELLFRSDVVVVTSRRILFKTRSYVASSVTSVKVQEQKDQRGARGGVSGPALGMVFLFGGCGLAIGGIYWGGDRAPAVLPIFLALGLLIAIMGLFMFRYGRLESKQDDALRFAVMFTTSDGHKERITGLTRPVAEKIAAAVSDASVISAAPPAHQSEAG